MVEHLVPIPVFLLASWFLPLVTRQAQPWLAQDRQIPPETTPHQNHLKVGLRALVRLKLLHSRKRIDRLILKHTKAETQALVNQWPSSVFSLEGAFGFFCPSVFFCNCFNWAPSTRCSCPLCFGGPAKWDGFSKPSKSTFSSQEIFLFSEVVLDRLRRQPSSGTQPERKIVRNNEKQLSEKLKHYQTKNLELPSIAVSAQYSNVRSYLSRLPMDFCRVNNTHGSIKALHWWVLSVGLFTYSIKCWIPKAHCCPVLSSSIALGLSTLQPSPPPLVSSGWQCLVLV